MNARRVQKATREEVAVAGQEARRVHEGGDQRAEFSIHDPTSRLTAEMELLRRAVSGDENSARRVVQYLDSPNSDLRGIMGDALHRLTPHDPTGPAAWRCLLGYFATRKWVDALGLLNVVGYERPTLTPDDTGRIECSPTALQTIAEVFIHDLDAAEHEVKHTLLRQALSSSGYLGVLGSGVVRQVRRAAACLSGLRGDMDVIPVLEMIIDAFNHERELEWPLRAIQALAVIKSERCGPALLKALDSKEAGLHRAAWTAMVECGKSMEATWLQALSHPNRHVRWHAARGLGLIGHLGGVDLLAEGLTHADQEVRWSAAETLSRLGQPALPAILNLLTRHPLDEPFRQAVYHALHGMSNPETQQLLKPLLTALRSPAAALEAPMAASRIIVKL